MRKVLALAVAAAGWLALAQPAGAITNGVPDGNGHPEVGALLAEQAFADGTWEECTGTLISPTVFLTAEHCDEGVSRVAVTFDTNYVYPTGTTYWGTWHGDPNYNHTSSNPDDLAVVVFDSPIHTITPARLPTLNQLAALPADARFTSVGYGAQSVTNGPGGKVLHYQDTRFVATGTFNALTKAWLKLSMNPAKGDGGTCYGDSGGPNFIGAGSTETNVIGGTTITGDAWCRATNVDYRLDTANARTFLGQFVRLP
jgi:V8-like Glu-specific endopeptidase